MNRQEATFEGTAGLRLYYRAWRPVAPPRGAVVIVHGFNAHSGYYLWVAERFVEAGLAVYALDLRGRGQSEGERFFVDTFDSYADDLGRLVDLVKERDPSVPLYVLGHSAGGVVACLYALDHQRQLAGLICESFAFQVPAPDFALSVMKGLSHVAPHAHVLKLKNEDFSRDPAAVATMNADPLIVGESQPLQTVAAMVRADERLRQEFSRLTLPVLILHGTLDKATRPSGSSLFYAQAGAQDKTLELYEGYFHDLLNDTGKEVVMSDILSWVGTRIDKASDA
jgi:alpha-beta hydrolase superfamily lysophospholipase